MAAAAQAVPPSPEVRVAVRYLLSSCQAFHELPPDERRSAARAMAKVCQTAVSLMQQEAEADLEVNARPFRRNHRTFAAAQATQPDFGASASKIAGTTQTVLNAVSFPRFVTELINGVFRALVDSNRQQMAAYVDLIKNVAASVDGFAEMNLGDDQARQWLVETFPGSLVVEGGADENTPAEDRAQENENARLVLREGASMPSEEALRSALGLAPEESIPTGDPETTLVPFARRAIARQRQQMLATMVRLGMQRIVIESGRLHAAMRFHIDTRSAAAAESGSKFNLENQTSIKANYWGVQAAMKNTIGYVSTQKQTSSEEMNTDLDLNSSVELVFKTDYLPLDRVAGKAQVDRIKVNTLNPEAEERISSQERQAREQGQRAADLARETQLESDLNPPRPSVTSKRASPAAPADSSSPQQGTAATTGTKATPAGGSQRGRGGAATQRPAQRAARQVASTPAGQQNNFRAMSLGSPRAAPDTLRTPMAASPKATDVGFFVRQPLQERCGFFGQDVVSESDLRNTLIQAAQTERQNWFDSAGSALVESDDSQFGHLVRYWLARFSDIRPDTLQAAQATAIGGNINYGQLLATNAAQGALTADVRRVRADLLSGAPGVGTPANLNALVEQALRKARSSRLNVDAWSAVFIVCCVRQAAIQLGLEAISVGTYIGQDGLLLADEAHRIFVAEAHRRRFDPNPMQGTYQAFRPSEARIQIGDIIVQDRQSRRPEDIMSFDRIPELANRGYALHSDIVVEVSDDGNDCVTIGGNLSDSVRRRRYPLNADGTLVVARQGLFTQENANGNLPDVPSTTSGNALHDLSTVRIFTVVSLVQSCVIAPGQEVNAGELIV